MQTNLINNLTGEKHVYTKKKNEATRLLWGALGVFLLLCGIFLGLYVGLWVCFVGGIIQIIQCATANPIDAMGVALGVLRFILSSLCSFVSFAVLGVPGMALINKN